VTSAGERHRVSARAAAHVQDAAGHALGSPPVGWRPVVLGREVLDDVPHGEVAVDRVRAVL
jgi:hypothetical protein